MGLMQANALRNSAQFSDVWTVSEHTGVTYPLFYGTWLFRMIGLFTLCFGTTLALRIFILVVVCAHFLHVNVRLRALRFETIPATVLSTLFVFSTYQLTNLFNRGAIAEFTAMLLLSSVWLETFYILQLPSAKERLTRYPFAFLLFALLLGSHAITAFYGILFSLLTLFPRWIKHREDRKLGVLLIALVLLMNGPWLYVLWKFGTQTTHAFASGFWPVYFPSDSFWGRFSPLPLARFNTGGTPGLDAQISLGLLALAIGSNFRRVSIASGLWIIFFVLAFASVVRLSDPVWLLWLRPLQFIYRSTNFLNLILFAIIVGSVVRFQRKEWVVGLLLWWAIGTAIKLDRARLNGDARLTTPLSGDTLPNTFYGISDFAVGSEPARLNEPPATLDLSRGQVEINPQVSSGWLRTNVYPHPWNKILIDGHSIALTDVHYKGIYTDVRIEVSRAHRLEYKYQPPRFFRSLQILSYLALLLLLFLTLRRKISP